MDFNPNLFDTFLNSRQQTTNISSAALKEKLPSNWREGGSFITQSTKLAYDPNDRESRTRYLCNSLAKEINYLQCKRLCRICKTPFRGYENIGRHACAYHPGFVQGHVMSCCGKHISTHGCQGCDHIPEPDPIQLLIQKQPPQSQWNSNNLLTRIPQDLVDSLPGIEKNVIPLLFEEEEDPVRSYLLVQRVALSAAEVEAHLHEYLEKQQLQV